MSQQNVCYYSTRCRYCQSFLEELSRSPYKTEFRFVCVDGTPKPILPPNIKAVPTLVIAGEAEPRTDGAVMNWLSERRLQERHAPGPSTSSPALSGPDMSGPVGYEDSFGGEGYAYIGEDTNATSGAMVRLTGSMAGINDLTSMTAPTVRGFDPPSNSVSAPAQKVSAKTKALDEAFAAYQAKRDMDVGPGIQRR